MLRLETDGGIILVPQKIEQDLLACPSGSDWSPEQATQVVRRALNDPRLRQRAADLLGAAVAYHHAGLSSEVAHTLARYARACGENLAATEDAYTGRWYMSASLQIAGQLVPVIAAQQDISQKIEELRDTFSDYLRMLAAISSVETLSHEAIKIAEVVTEFTPYASQPLSECLRGLGAVLDMLASDLSHYPTAKMRLSELRRKVHGDLRRTPEQVHLLELVEAWEALLSVHIDREGLATQPLSEIELEVQKSIRRLERTLRRLIEEKYTGLYGASWVEHIRARHPTMVEYWSVARDKDRRAFNGYDNYAPSALEYARFDDLSELITAQWQAFRQVLDFKEDKGNRARFVDMMKAIAKVRNPIAHHRTIPQTELYRAKVFCDDILNAIQASTPKQS